MGNEQVESEVASSSNPSSSTFQTHGNNDWGTMSISERQVFLNTAITQQLPPAVSMQFQDTMFLMCQTLTTLSRHESSSPQDFFNYMNTSMFTYTTIALKEAFESTLGAGKQAEAHEQDQEEEEEEEDELQSNANQSSSEANDFDDMDVGDD